MQNSPLLIDDSNISLAWKRVLEQILLNPKREITPLIVSLSDFGENADIRNCLDLSLSEKGETSIDTVSETIFPISLQKLYKDNRHELYDGYKEILPRIHKLHPNNRRGTYFERLIDFDGKNQLEIIIDSLKQKRTVRRSKLQASIFDPRKDHLDTPYQGFPCLQHVTFYISRNGGLVLNSFYAVQLLYRKAYGNWLGLSNLGKFVARESNCNFERLNCFIGVEQFELSKGEGKELLKK